MAELQALKLAGQAKAGPRAKRPTWILGLAAAVAGLVLVIVLGYQLALAKVPQHRAALERLVQSQTGLDVRFSELGLRWGWYGPEAVFRSVELGEPGRSNVLLRAPELTVGFDARRICSTKGVADPLGSGSRNVPPSTSMRPSRQR